MTWILHDHPVSTGAIDIAPRVGVLHDPPDTDSDSLTLMDYEGIVPAAYGEPRPPLVSSPEPAGPATELNLASGEQVTLRVQPDAVLDAEPSSGKAYVGRVFIPLLQHNRSKAAIAIAGRSRLI